MRVFIPTNDDSHADYWLHHPRSVADLTALGAALKDGISVTLFGPSGVELAAVLQFQVEVNCWVAYTAR